MKHICIAVPLETYGILMIMESTRKELLFNLRLTFKDTRNPSFYNITLDCLMMGQTNP